MCTATTTAATRPRASPADASAWTIRCTPVSYTHLDVYKRQIPTLYSLALDTYQSGGEELVNRLDQLNGQEQNAQTL